MSTSVDERIVEMRFNNKQFEEGIKESTDSLANLRKSLKLEDASKGLKDIESAGKQFSLSTVTEALESVTNKFSVLGTIGDQIIRTLTDKFMGLAGQAVNVTKALSVDQIAAGWEKYENKTEAVQTIMNATGKDIDYVNERLEKLQWFTDETSYNFVDMTSSIGDFTNAGVELDDAVNAMMGIANWAAVSGGNVQQAGIAMRNLSQAMSMDKVLVTDWMSIEKAGMATMEFKQNVIDTAVELGYLRDMGNGVIETMGGAEVTAEGFRGTLEEGWFSGAVLTETLKKYSEYTNAVYEVADAYDTCSEAMEHVSEEGMELSAKAFKAGQQYKTFKDIIDATKDAVSSGWMTTFELIFGNMEQAKSLWTDVGGMFWDIFASGAEARNEVLSVWRNDMDGWEFVTDSIWSIYSAFESVREAAREGWQQVFPEMTAERFFEITKSINKFFNRIADWAKDAKTMERITTIFKGFGSAIQVAKKIISALFAPLKRLKESLDESGTGVLDLTARFFDLFTRLNESEKFQNVLDKISEKIGDILVWLVKAVQKIKQALSDAKEFIEPYAQKVKEAFGKIRDAIKSLGKTDTSETESVFERIKRVIEPLSELFEPIIKMVKFVITVFKKLGPILMSVFKTIWKVIGDLFGGLTTALEGLDTGKIMEMLKGGGIVAVLFNISSALKEFKGVASGLGGTLGSFKDLASSFKDGIGDIVNVVKKVAQVKSFKTVATSIAILAASVLVLSMIEPARLASATAAIVALFIALFSSTGAINKNMDTKKIAKVAGQMIGYSIAILILAAALKKVAALNPTEIENGLMAIGGLMGELILAFKMLTSNSGQTKKIVKVAVGLILLAVAIRLLVKPMKELGAMDIESIKKGLVSIGILLAELALFTQIAGGTKKMVSIGLGMIELSLAMKILAGVVATFGAMDIPSLAKGLIAVGVSITGIAAAMKLMPKGMITKATGFVILAAGLKIIASVMKDISALSWEGIAKGLVSIGVAVVGIAAAMSVFMSNRDILKATGFVILAAGLKIIASVMKDISEISWENVLKSLVSIGAAVVGLAAAMQLMPDSIISKAAAMVILALSLKVLASVLEDISMLSWEDIAKGLITIGVAAVGLAAAMQIMPNGVSGAASLLIIALALNAIVPVLKAIGEMSMQDIVKALVGLGGALAVVIGAAYIFTSFSAEFSSALLKIAAGAALFAVAMEVIVRAIANLTELGKAATDTLLATTKAFLAELPELLKLFAQAIITAMPELVKMVSSIIAGLIKVIQENVPAFVETILSVVLNILEKLVEYAPAIVENLFTFLMTIFDGLRKYVPMIIKDVMLMLRDILEGIFEALDGLSVSNVAKALVGLAAIGAIFTELAVIAALGAATTALLIPIAKNLNKFVDAIQPFLEKIQHVDHRSLLGAEALGNTVLALTKASILEALTGWFRGDSGGMLKFGEQIAQLGPYIAQYAASIDGIDADSVMKSALAASAIAEFANNLPRHGGLVQLITGDNDIVEFVNGLVELGPALKNYANSVNGLDATAVTNSVNAAQVISAFADNLPRHGGFVQALIGDNSLNQFAQDLTVFGPNLMAYARSVTGLNADVVIASVNAAEAISAMANGLPNQGGAVSWFAGDNTLSAFGTELAAFGPLFAKYGDAIKDIKPDVVIASALAAQALFAVAQNVPNQGGVVSWFAGDNKLSDFALGLVPFGQGIARYSESVDGTINVEAIEASANAAAAIFEVAALAPNQGGVISWFAGDNKLGDFAAGLEPFGEAIKSYGAAVDGLNVGDIEASMTATAAIFETAAKMPNQGGVVSWFAGDNKIGDFAEGLKPFGESLKSFGESVDGLNNDDILLATQTMKDLFDVASKMPNQGGIISWFAGDNKLSDFAKELAAFGPEFRKYGESIADIKMSNVSASGRALKVLFESIESLPNQGGVVSWFTGDNTLGAIGKDLEVFGPSFSSFAKSLDGVNQTGVVLAFSSLRTLAAVLNEIPNQGGFVSWFVGDNTLGAVGKDLAVFGPAYSEFANNLNPASVSSATAAFEGIRYLAEAIAAMPNQGGMVSWFTGDQGLAGIADDLAELGPSLAKFSDDIVGFKIVPVTLAFTALRTLGETLDALPKEGGLVQWFTGETSLANIGVGLKEFGPAFASFSNDVADLKTGPVEAAFATIKVLAESLDTMPPQGGLVQWFSGEQSLANIGEGLIKFAPAFVYFSKEMEDLKIDPVERAFECIAVLANSLDKIPPQGGVVQWFSGEQSLANIGEDLEVFGPKFKAFGDSVKGINVATIKNSFRATAILIDSLDSIPPKGGVKQWFTGDQSLANIGDDLPSYGKALYEYYISVTHINFDKINTSIDATKGFVESMEALQPKRAKFIEWFTGSQSLSNLGKDLVSYGKSLVSFSDSVSDLKYSAIVASVAFTERVVDLVSAMEPLGGWDAFWSGEKSLDTLGDQLASLGGYLASYEKNTADISWDKLSSSIDTLYKFLDLGKDLYGVDFSGYWNFAESFNDLALTGTDTFIQTFEGKYDTVKEVGQKFIQNVIDGLNDKSSDLASTTMTISGQIVAGLDSQNNINNSSWKVGWNLVQGLIDGMNSNSNAAYTTSAYIGRKTYEYMKQATQEHSPSRATYQIGEYLVQGLINGMDDNTNKATDVSSEIGSEVLLAMETAIANVMALMQSGMVLSPVIRPVIDMSEAKDQVDQAGDLFSNQVIAGTGFSTAAGLNRTIQNGSTVGGISNNTTNNSAAITFNIYGAKGQDAKDIADEVQKRLKMDLDRRGYAYR